MKIRKSIILLTVLFSSPVLLGETALQPGDRQLISQLEGCYAVADQFKEVFVWKHNHPHTSKEYKLYYYQWREVVQDDENGVLINEITFSKDTFVRTQAKWRYEAREHFVYQRDGLWQVQGMTEAAVRGTWSREDRAPYGGPYSVCRGSWLTHRYERPYFECEGMEPRPKRESHREDYNALKVRERWGPASWGWFVEFDNRKVQLTSGADYDEFSTEKGYVWNTKVDNASCQAAIDWWDVRKEAWNAIDQIWDHILNGKQVAAFHSPSEQSSLEQKLLELVEQFVRKEINGEKLKDEAKKAISAALTID